MENFVDEITLASKLQESRWTIRTWRVKYGLPYIKLGRRIIYDVNAVKEWLQNQSISNITTPCNTLMSPIY